MSTDYHHGQIKFYQSLRKVIVNDISRKRKRKVMKEKIIFRTKTKMTIKSHLTLVIQKNQMKIMTLLSKKMLMLTHMVQMKKNINISIILNLLLVELVIMIQQKYFLNNISRKRKRKVKKKKIIIRVKTKMTTKSHLNLVDQKN